MHAPQIHGNLLRGQTRAYGDAAGGHIFVPVEEASGVVG